MIEKFLVLYIDSSYDWKYKIKILASINFTNEQGEVHHVSPFCNFIASANDTFSCLESAAAQNPIENESLTKDVLLASYIPTPPLILMKAEKKVDVDTVPYWFSFLLSFSLIFPSFLFVSTLQPGTRVFKHPSKNFFIWYT